MARMVPVPVHVEVSITGPVDEEFIHWFRASIRTHLEHISGTPPERAEWVLVKGWHDQGGVEAVIGPYTEQHADWLLSSVLDNTYNNWTKAKLSSGPEEP